MATALSDGRLKFIQERIGKVDQQFGDICHATSAYVRILAKLRDKGDDVSKVLLAYAQSETLNLTTKTALTEFVENFSAVEDFRNVQIQRLDSKIIEPMMQYGPSCKKAKERIKEAFAAHAKELRQRSLKATSQTGKEQMYQQGMTDALKANRELEEEIDSFERKKLHDIKTLLSDFVNVELSFHAKALEMYTLCYRSMASIREDHDLQYRESLRPLIRRLSDQPMNASSNSASSTGRTLLRTSKFLEVIGVRERKEEGARQRNGNSSNDAASTPASTASSSSSLYASSSQNGESDGVNRESDGFNGESDVFTEDGEENASDEDETSDEDKQRRK